MTCGSFPYVFGFLGFPSLKWGVVWDHKGIQVLVLQTLVLGFVVLVLVGSVLCIQGLITFFRLGSLVLSDVGISNSIIRRLPTHVGYWMASGVFDSANCHDLQTDCVQAGSGRLLNAMRSILHRDSTKDPSQTLRPMAETTVFAHAFESETLNPKHLTFLNP